MGEFYVVWGMHRSGTSLAAAALRIFGAEAGNSLLAPDEYNKKGYFEDSGLIKLNEAMLRHVHRRWFSLERISKAETDELKKAGYLAKARDYLAERSTEAAAIGLKDPRMAMLGAIWREAFAGLGIRPYSLTMWRSPFAVARSLAARAAHIPHYTPVGDETYGILLWLAYMLDAMYYTHSYPAVLINYDDLLDRPYQIMQDAARILGVDADPDRLEKFCRSTADPALRTHESRGRSLDGLAGQLYEQLKACRNLEFPPMRGRLWPSQPDEMRLASLLDSANLRLREKEDESVELKMTLIKAARLLRPADR